MYSELKSYMTSNGQTVAVVPRPALDSYNYIIPGFPESVKWYGEYFTTLLGICVKDFQEHQPDLVVYQLADGSLLAADAETIKASKVQKHSRWNKSAYETEVTKLQILTKLPE